MRLIPFLLLIFSSVDLFQQKYKIQHHQEQEQEQYGHIITASAQTPINKPIISFCSGFFHVCAVFNTKMMKCIGFIPSWGVSSSGSLGVKESELGNNIPYVDVGTNANIVQVSCGSQHTCVILDTGDMKCLGHNAAGQVGVGVTTGLIGKVSGHGGDMLPVVNVGDGLKVFDVALGTYHTCMVVTGNKVKCIGFNQDGQLGLGDDVNRGAKTSQMGNNLPFVDLGSNIEALSIHSGEFANHNCIIISKPVAYNQRIKCWGSNAYRQLGYGSDTNNRGDAPNEMGDMLPVVDFGVESRVKQLGLSGGFACALLLNDNLKCYGSGGNGQLASGSQANIITTGDAMPIVQVDAGKKVKLLETGSQHTCVVYDDNTTLKCFGSNNKGQLGQGDIVNRGSTPNTTLSQTPPIDLGTGSLNMIAIHAGRDFNCVIYVDSSVKCFGENSYGQCGVGTGFNIGDGTKEMGSNLKFAMLFSPAPAPTAPTESYRPTKSPTVKDTPKDLEIGLGVSFSILIVALILYLCISVNQQRKLNQNGNIKAMESEEEATKEKIGTRLFVISSSQDDDNLLGVKNLLLNGFEKKVQFLSCSNKATVDEINRFVKSSDATVIILTKSIFENPRKLVETFLSLKLEPHLYLIYITTSGFELSTTIELLKNIALSNPSVKKITKEIETMSLDAIEVANKLLLHIPNMTTLRYDKDGPVANREQDILKLVTAIQEKPRNERSIILLGLGFTRLADANIHSKAMCKINSPSIDENGQDEQTNHQDYENHLSDTNNVSLTIVNA